MGNKRNGKAAKSIRKQSADLRSESKLTPQEQLASLDARFGVGVGATKERAKLAKRIAA